MLPHFVSAWQSSFELQSPEFSLQGCSGVQKLVCPIVGANVAGAIVVGAIVVVPAKPESIHFVVFLNLP